MNLMGGMELIIEQSWSSHWWPTSTGPAFITELLPTIIQFGFQEEEVLCVFF